MRSPKVTEVQEQGGEERSVGDDEERCGVGVGGY